MNGLFENELVLIDNPSNLLDILIKTQLILLKYINNNDDYSHLIETYSSLLTSAFFLNDDTLKCQSTYDTLINSVNQLNNPVFILNFIKGIFGHPHVLIKPALGCHLLLNYFNNFNTSNHDLISRTISLFSPILINILALANYSSHGYNLTSYLIQIDTISIVNDWANCAKDQINESKNNEGIHKLKHYLKLNILNQFFIQHTGFPIDNQINGTSGRKSNLPVIHAPDWFKNDNSNTFTTQKVYSSNEFRTLRMAAQGIRAPSKHVDSFQ